MKTLQVKDRDTAPNGEVETLLWEGKSAREVQREQYHDNCVLTPVEQPRTNSPTVSRPQTYIVRDRSEACGREDEGDSIGVLIEIPD